MFNDFAILAIAASGIIAMMVITPNFLNSVIGLFTGASEDPSITSRTDSFSLAFEFIARQPLFGRGLGTFLPKYRIFDNQYLLLLVTIGVLGTLAFIAVGITAVVMIVRLRKHLRDEGSRDLALGLCAALCAGFSCLFMFDAFAFPMTMGALFLILGIAGAFRRIVSMERDRGRTCKMTTVPVDIAAVVVTFNSERPHRRPSRQHSGRDGRPHALCGRRRQRLHRPHPRVLDARTDCIVVRSRNDGYAAGINRAVRHSPDASAILILNPDATLDPVAVPPMLEVLRRPGTGVVAPRVREADGSLSPTLRRGPTMGRVGGMSFTGWPASPSASKIRGEYETEHEVEWAVGAILLVDTRCYRRPRRHGRVLLPLLGGDRLQPSREGRRVGHGLHPGRRRDARRWRLGRERDHPHDEDPQPRPPLSSAARHPTRIDLLRAHRADRGAASHPRPRQVMADAARTVASVDSTPAPRRVRQSASAMMHERGHQGMKVLMIAPACDGEDVGEAWVAFQWAKLLSERLDLTF